MEEKKMFLVIIIALVLLAVIISGIVIIFQNEDSTLISAKEGYYKAQNLAENWSDDAVLTHVSSVNNTVDGKCNAWRYHFYSPSSINNTPYYQSCNYLDVWLYANGSVYDHLYENAGLNPDATAVMNWNIDSDEAFKIVDTEARITEYIENNTDDSGSTQTAIRTHSSYVSIKSELNLTTVRIGVYITYWNYEHDNFFWNIDAESGQILESNFEPATL